jgi:hypothetical protein
MWDQQQRKLEDIKTNGDCCFNHIIGLPTKEGIDRPILYDALLARVLLFQKQTSMGKKSNRTRSY